MKAIELLLDELQRRLNLTAENNFRFPLGIRDGDKDKTDIHVYIKKMCREKDEDTVYNFFSRFEARKFLTWVVFVAALVVSALAIADLIGIIFKLPYLELAR